MKNDSVLIIEDNEEESRLIRLILEEDGFEVHTAPTLRTARLALAAFVPDVVLIDLGLPDGCGSTLIPEINAGDSSISCVVLTASLKPEDALSAIDAGAFDYLQKPINAGLLLAAVRRAASFTNLRRENTKRVADVAHELRNPLGVIQGYAHMLDAVIDSVKGEQTHDWILRLNDSCEQLKLLIDDLLDLEMNRNGWTLDQKKVSPRTMLAELEKDYRSQARMRGIDLELKVSKEAPSVLADSRRLRQVFSNLMGNALKFTPDGGCIEINAWKENEQLIICIADSGPGMTPEEAQRVFEHRYQTDIGRACRSGLGLGLTIASEIISAHNGRIWAESEREGGSRFYVAIPEGSDTVNVDPLIAAESASNRPPCDSTKLFAI